MNPNTYRTTACALAAVSLSCLLAACQRPETANEAAKSGEKTVGQKLDTAVASAEQKAAQATNEVKAAAANASEKVKGTASDMAITAEVKTRLARDAQLSAFDINVDTSAGRVVLKGSAPDLAARERARSLASSVAGVQAVENQLVINAKS